MLEDLKNKAKLFKVFYRKTKSLKGKIKNYFISYAMIGISSPWIVDFIFELSKNTDRLSIAIILKVSLSVVMGLICFLLFGILTEKFFIKRNKKILKENNLEFLKGFIDLGEVYNKKEISKLSDFFYELPNEVQEKIRKNPQILKSDENSIIYEILLLKSLDKNTEKISFNILLENIKLINYEEYFTFILLEKYLKCCNMQEFYENRINILNIIKEKMNEIEYKSKLTELVESNINEIDKEKTVNNKIDNMILKAEKKQTIKIDPVDKSLIRKI